MSSLLFTIERDGQQANANANKGVKDFRFSILFHVYILFCLFLALAFPRSLSHTVPTRIKRRLYINITYAFFLFYYFLVLFLFCLLFSSVVSCFNFHICFKSIFTFLLTSYFPFPPIHPAYIFTPLCIFCFLLNLRNFRLTSFVHHHLLFAFFSRERSIPLLHSSLRACFLCGA